MPQEQSYLSYFTPSQMSAEMLESILVKRQNLAARLVERTKQSVLTPTKHQTLLLGPRGMGKSYLVALVYHRVKALPELADKIAIAYFAEEEWSITSLTDLLLVILKALEREYGGLQKRLEALYCLPIRDIETAAGNLIREFVGERTLFLLVENLNEIFRGLGEQGEWAFRSFISERPFVTILATSPSLFAGVTEHDSAFYGFFQNIYLEELTAEEATELLEKVAKRRDDTALAAFLKTPTARERVQAVHDLAGGHPRIYLLFAHLLTQETLDELVTPFMQLLDELTPYYQSRMQLLSPQQRKIVEFLCSARGAVSVKEIAAQNLMTSQTASGQLDKLEEMAYVRKTPVGRASFYELREPLLRMVIEVKRGRGEPIRLIVDFLRRWYNRRERQERLSFTSPHYPMTHAYLTASLDLKRAQEDKPDLKRARRFSSEYEKCKAAKQFDRACELAAEIIERKGKACEPHDWFEYAHCLYLTDQNAIALPVLDDIVEHTPEYVWGWGIRGANLQAMGHTSAALESYNKGISLAPNDANLWFLRGALYQELGNASAALADLDRGLEIDQNFASAWNYRGIALGSLSDTQEALQSFDRAIEIDPTDSPIWNNRGILLYDSGQYVSALASFEKALELSPQEASSWFRWAMVQLALGDWNECIKGVAHGFASSPLSHRESWCTQEFCRLLLGQEGFQEKIKILVQIYTEYDALGLLGQGLTQSIRTVVSAEVSQSVAESWQTEWQSVRKTEPRLGIPVRLLTAAVGWKKTRSVQALMSLPIEERRILESLLPSAETSNEP